MKKRYIITCLVAATLSATLATAACEESPPADSTLRGTYQASGYVPDLGTNPSLEFLPKNKVKFRESGGMSALADATVEGNQLTLLFAQGRFYEFTIYPDRLVFRSGQVFRKR